MKDFIEQRVKDEAQCILQNRYTLRETAKLFGVSKSTIHKDMIERLRTVNGETYKQVREVLDFHLFTRAINGGEATRLRWLQ